MSKDLHFEERFYFVFLLKSRIYNVIISSISKVTDDCAQNTHVKTVLRPSQTTMRVDES